MINVESLPMLCHYQRNLIAENKVGSDLPTFINPSLYQEANKTRPGESVKLKTARTLK